MQVEIITPEAEIFKAEAEAVQFPGLDGSFQVLNGHAPIISALSNGKIKVNLVDSVEEEGLNEKVEVGSDKKIVHIAIKGGVIEMLNNKIIVLAE